MSNHSNADSSFPGHFVYDLNVNTSKIYIHSVKGQRHNSTNDIYTVSLSLTALRGRRQLLYKLPLNGCQLSWELVIQLGGDRNVISGDVDLVWCASPASVCAQCLGTWQRCVTSRDVRLMTSLAGAASHHGLQGSHLAQQTGVLLLEGFHPLSIVCVLRHKNFNLPF